MADRRILIRGPADLRHQIRHLAVRLQFTARGQYAGDQPEQRFRYRHQDVRRRFGHTIGVSLEDDPAASGDDDAVGARFGEKFIERKRPGPVGLDRDVTDLDAVDPPFVHIGRIVHDLC